MKYSDLMLLKPGELGFGILEENDAGFLSSDLTPMVLGEGVKIKPNEPILINCILQKWGVKNKNGRTYPKEILVPQVAEYQKLVSVNSAVSEADHPDCVYASESMICTKNGWKSFEDISDDEEILTLNINTNKIEIQRIDEKIYTNYKGKMYKFSNKNSLELTVTSNHRHLIERDGKREYYTTEEIISDKNGVFSSGKSKLIKTGEWNGNYSKYFTLNGVLPDSLSFNSKHNSIEKYTTPINIISEDWFAFMGIYLSEGHSCGAKSGRYKSNGYSVVITQKKEETKVLIEDLLNKLPFEYWKTAYSDGKVQYHINDARLYNYLFPLGHSLTKYIPFDIKQASKELLSILFKWFMIGDGRNVKSTHETWSNKQSVFSVSKKLIYDLHEILIKIGGSGNITTYQPKDRHINENDIPRLIKCENSQLQYNLNISKTNNIYLDKRFVTISEIDFNDSIACVRVKNSNFLVMVNGKTHWTGNSSIISLQNLSHMITKMWWGTGEQENILFGELKLIVTRGYIEQGIVSVIGDKILLYLENKIKLGISSRGVGTLKEIHGENIVQNDFELIGFDLVLTPSTPGAYLFPVANGNTKFGESYQKNENGIYLNENNKIITGIDNFLLL